MGDRTMSQAVAEHRARKRAKRDANQAKRDAKASKRAGKQSRRSDPEAVAARKAAAAQHKADQAAKRAANKAKREAKNAQARAKKQARGRKDQETAEVWNKFQAERKMLKQNEKVALEAEKKALREKLKELDAQKKATRQEATAQIKFIKQQFKDARSRLEKGRPAKPNQTWSWWKGQSNKSAKADPKATTMEMQQHLGGVAVGPAHAALPQHPTRFDNVPVLTAEDIHMSSLEDVEEGVRQLTLGDYCLLTAIVLCIAYLIYKLYMACKARREANQNEEAMLAQAIELSQDPQVHEVVVGHRLVTVPVPVYQAGQQKIVSIQMPQTQANAVSAVQGNAMPRGTDLSQASSQAPGCPSMFGN